MSQLSDFDESSSAAGPAPPPGDALVVNIDGFEGPIDLLLTLAREQKVDLQKISILALAEQYLAFIAAAKRLRLEIAADYLVMAAWLAYLKSRLLLPQHERAEEDGPDAEEMAALLAFQLRRLEAMREAGVRLLARPQLGRDTFNRGAPEGLAVVSRPVYELALFDLLKAYGENKQRKQAGVLHIAPTEYYSMDDALHLLGRIVGRVPDWTALLQFLPADLRDETALRSAVASVFAATLELARSGRAQLRQEKIFGPIYLRSPGPTLVPPAPVPPQPVPPHAGPGTAAAE